MSRPLVALVLLAAAAFPARSQTDSRPAVADSQAAAEALLKEVDARIYYPVLQGLEDLRFRWKMSGTGVFEVMNDIYLQYTWKKPDKVRIEYVDAKGKPLEKLPEISNDPNGARVFAQVRQSIHVMAQQVLIGVPLSRIYRDYYKELKKREVNNKIEYDIVMTPRSKKNWSKIVMKVIEGLPRRSIKTDANGDVYDFLQRYEPRGDKFLLMGFKVETNNQLLQEEGYSYVKKKGIFALTSLERGLTQGEVRREVLKLEALQVNFGVADSYFEDT